MSEDNQTERVEGNGSPAGESTAEPITDWKQALPEEIRETPAIQNFKTPADLAKSYLHQQKFIGKEKLPVPKDETDKEAWDIVYDRLGRPSKPEGYELPKMDNIRTDALGPKEYVDDFKKFAHSIGLTNRQVSELYKWNAELGTNILNKRDEAYQEAMLKGETQLRREWGDAFPEKLELAKQAFRAFVPKEKINFFETSGLGNDPDFIKMFAGIAMKMSEASVQGASKNLTLTPYEAKKEIMDMLSNPKSPLNISDHPEHNAAVERRIQLEEVVSRGNA